MAKYDVTYACGHSATIQLFGPEKERTRKRAWLAKQRCFQCDRVHREAEGPKARLRFVGAGIDGRGVGSFAVALRDAYPIRETLSAAGYHFDREPYDLEGPLGFLGGGKVAPVWRKDFPLTEEGRDAWIAEGDRLVAEGLVKQEHLDLPTDVGLEVQIAFHRRALADRAKKKG